MIGAHRSQADGAARVARFLGPYVWVRKQYHFSPGANGVDAWDVERVVELAASLPVGEVELAVIDEIDTAYWFDLGTARPTVRTIVEHLRLIEEADLSYPIILGADGRVMDGMHRVARALLEGRTTAKAVRFSEQPPPDHLDCRPEDLLN